MERQASKRCRTLNPSLTATYIYRYLEYSGRELSPQIAKRIGSRSQNNLLSSRV